MDKLKTIWQFARKDHWTQPAVCVHASNVNMFKNRIDKHLVKAGYTYNRIRAGYT